MNRRRRKKRGSKGRKRRERRKKRRRRRSGGGEGGGEGVRVGGGSTFILMNVFKNRLRIRSFSWLPFFTLNTFQSYT